MSPEAVEGELALDGRTDIFAAGVVLYELLTGKRLFKGGDDLRTIALVRACKVDPPSRERSDIPAELDRIVLKALARDREQRYQRADELAADLNQVAHGLQWDATRTSVFLKQNDIQPGSEPELRAIPAACLWPPSPSRSPATMQVTVVERRGRAFQHVAARRSDGPASAGRWWGLPEPWPSPARWSWGFGCGPEPGPRRCRRRRCPRCPSPASTRAPTR